MPRKTDPHPQTLPPRTTRAAAWGLAAGLCVALFAAGTTACRDGHATTGAGAPAGPGAAPVAIAFETALSGGSSGISVAETVSVRDAAQWQALWQRHASLMVPPPPAPAHDFGGRQMVGVFLGAAPDGCQGVQVTSVVRQPRAVVVRYRVQRAGRGEACTQAITQPHHLVWITATELPVVFEKR